MSETKFITVMFECDIKKLANPFQLDTPFGKPVIIALGDVFEQRDELEERLQEMEQIAP